jgi:hypothetical protein
MKLSLGRAAKGAARLVLRTGSPAPRVCCVGGFDDEVFVFGESDIGERELRQHRVHLHGRFSEAEILRPRNRAHGDSSIRNREVG